MPARITVQTGISAGASHWIEQRVVRVGSDPTADVCIPSAEMPTHALTVEFRRGNYHVYNRSPSNVFLGTHVLSPNQAAIWYDTDILQLADEIELVLDVDANPAPAARRMAAAERVATPYETEAGDSMLAEMNSANERPVASGGPSTWWQLVVIALCVVGCALLLARHRSRVAGFEAEKGPLFAEVVQLALTSETTSRDLLNRLQHAESAWVRGDLTAAASRYEQLRDDLLSQREQFVRDKRTVELEIMRFVEFRLRGT